MKKTTKAAAAAIAVILAVAASNTITGNASSYTRGGIISIGRLADDINYRTYKYTKTQTSHVREYTATSSTYPIGSYGELQYDENGDGKNDVIISSNEIHTAARYFQSLTEDVGDVIGLGRVNSEGDETVIGQSMRVQKIYDMIGTF